jgi:hypothetical protein
MTGQVIIGCGYTGERLARRLGGQPLAFTGSEPGARRLRAAGIEARVWNLDQLAFATVDVTGAIVYYLAPPPETARVTRVSPAASRRCAAGRASSST